MGASLLVSKCNPGEADSLGQDVLSVTRSRPVRVDSLSEGISGAGSNPVCPGCPRLSDGFYEAFLSSASFFAW